jgi:hypothetical protein
MTHIRNQEAFNVPILSYYPCPWIGATRHSEFTGFALADTLSLFLAPLGFKAFAEVYFSDLYSSGCLVRLIQGMPTVPSIYKSLMRLDTDVYLHFVAPSFEKIDTLQLLLTRAAVANICPILQALLRGFNIRFDHSP